MNSKKAYGAELKKHLLFFAISLLMVVVLSAFLCTVTYAAPGISIDLNAGEDSGGTLGAIELLFLMAILALAPSILIMMTSFTRIVIVLSFLRNALGTQQSPPNQVLVGLALFLTLFIMNPVITEINKTAYIPYKEGVITQEVAAQRAVKPLKVFMLKQTQKKDLNMFLSISKSPVPQLKEGQSIEAFTDLGLEVIVPSFITSELKRAFTMGFLLFIPFLIIDMVVASTLMSMGMVMLPPAMIALPFKIMMFVLVDGWGMLMGTLVQSFR